MLTVRLLGLFAIIPATLLLTVSFFVLFSIRRTDAHGLKAFGYVVAAFLWAATLLVVSAGIYTVSTGRHPAMCMMQQMMMKCPMQQMMQGQKSGMMGGPMSMMQGQHPMMMKDKMPAMGQGQGDDAAMKR